ncbi:MAG: polyphosphate kinase 2 family protein [Chloroflexi bacterium]|nr:polyphosphate kinase 2 family protein [Chloroflexota bacterium]
MDFREEFFVRPEHRLHLSHIDPGYKGDHDTEKLAEEQTAKYHASIGRLQSVMAAQKEHALLIVLQGLDAAGKDGTIKHVFSALNPQGVSTVAFKEPTAVELEHDFLWRVHPHTPGRGQIAIFNRSHYEDVLVARVHGLVDKATWTERYALIQNFERGLLAAGTVVLKFFLHISRHEQLQRFKERLDDPARNWKISEADYLERERWNAYRHAYEDALAATSTRHAPWYVIPANHKWFRNLAVSQIVASALEDLDLAYPAATVDLEQIRRQYERALEAERKGE